MSTCTAEATTTRCRCGHSADAHEHFRRGSDCSGCGPEVCPRFVAEQPAAATPVLRLPAQAGLVAGMVRRLTR